jgi:hypothetical protein
MKRIKKGDKGYEMKDVTKKQAQSVHFAKDEIMAKKPDNPVGPFGDVDQVYKPNNRYE